MMWSGGDACVARRGGVFGSREQDAGDASVPSPLNPTPAPTERHRFSGYFPKNLLVKDPCGRPRP